MFGYNNEIQITPLANGFIVMLPQDPTGYGDQFKEAMTEAAKVMSKEMRKDVVDELQEENELLDKNGYERIPLVGEPQRRNIVRIPNIFFFRTFPAVLDFLKKTFIPKEDTEPK